jgi:hypothetical protein
MATIDAIKPNTIAGTLKIGSLVKRLTSEPETFLSLYARQRSSGGDEVERQIKSTFELGVIKIWLK